MSYLLHLLVYFEIFALVAASLNLLIGHGGLLQVAHAGYFGIGAYTVALLGPRLGFVPAIVVAAGFGAASSLLTSLPAWRFRGDAFVMMSIAVQLGIFAVLNNVTPLTGGPFGIAGIPRPAILGIQVATKGGFLALYGGIVVACLLALAILKRSPFGRSLQATRDDELAARSLGIPVRKVKVQAFAAATAVVGLAGGLFAAYSSYIDPSSFDLDESILLLSMVIVGGTGNFRGPLVGAATLIAIPEILRLTPLDAAVAANVRLLAYGLLLVVLMRWRPQGLAGRYRLE